MISTVTWGCWQGKVILDRILDFFPLPPRRGRKKKEQDKLNVGQLDPVNLNSINMEHSQNQKEMNKTEFSNYITLLNDELYKLCVKLKDDNIKLQGQLEAEQVHNRILKDANVELLWKLERVSKINQQLIEQDNNHQNKIYELEQQIEFEREFNKTSLMVQNYLQAEREIEKLTELNWKLEKVYMQIKGYWLDKNSAIWYKHTPLPYKSGHYTYVKVGEVL